MIVKDCCSEQWLFKLCVLHSECAFCYDTNSQFGVHNVSKICHYNDNLLQAIILLSFEFWSHAQYQSAYYSSYMFDQQSWRNFKAIDNYCITMKIRVNHTDRFALDRQMRYIDACLVTVRIYTVVGTIKQMWHLPSLASLLVCCPNQGHNNFNTELDCSGNGSAAS
jgi:hypothetical protein